LAGDGSDQHCAASHSQFEQLGSEIGDSLQPHLKYSRFWDARAGDRARSALPGVGRSLAQAAVRRYAIGWRKEHDAQQGESPMPRELEGKVAVVTGAASGIGLASTEAMLAAGSRVVMVDRDEAALKVLCNKHGDAVIPLVIDLLDPKDCATLLPRVLENAGQLDILHANAGTYVGGDLIDADTGAIDRMLNLNVNVVMKNVHDVLPHMIERRTGDIIVTSSLAAHFPTPWEPVYASSKWAINCFVQTVRRQVFKHGIRVGSVSPGPVISALLADWPPEKLKEARESGSLLEASEVANVVIFMLTRPRGMTIRDVVMLPTNFDL
jgi:ribitol 2-dehydrogenase